MTSASTPSRSMSLIRRCGSLQRRMSLAVLVHPGFGHLVDPVVLPGNKGRAARPDTVLQPEICAVLGDPLRSLRPILDVRHAVLQLPRSLRHKEVGRHPRHVEMAVGRDSAVLHFVFSALRGIAIRPTVLPPREHLLAVTRCPPCCFCWCDMTETHRYTSSRDGLRLHATYDINMITST